MWLTTIEREFPVLSENFLKDFFGLASSRQDFSFKTSERAKAPLKDGKYHLTVVAPGLYRDDFLVELQGNQLIVSYDVSKRDDAVVEQKKYRQVWNIPANTKFADVSASYKQGILTILIPARKVEETKTQKIKVT